MSVSAAYGYIGQFFNAVQDVLESMQVANKAASPASRGDHERAKVIVLETRI